jgi:hypothetical protein
VGTPDEIKTIIRRVIERFGQFEHASLQINFGSMALADALRSMRLFASEVMPEFADAPGATAIRSASGSSRAQA